MNELKNNKAVVNSIMKDFCGTIGTLLSTIDRSDSRFNNAFFIYNYPTAVSGYCMLNKKFNVDQREHQLDVFMDAYNNMLDNPVTNKILDDFMNDKYDMTKYTEEELDTIVYVLYVITFSDGARKI